MQFFFIIQMLWAIEKKKLSHFLSSVNHMFKSYSIVSLKLRIYFHSLNEVKNENILLFGKLSGRWSLYLIMCFLIYC